MSVDKLQELNKSLTNPIPATNKEDPESYLGQLRQMSREGAPRKDREVGDSKYDAGNILPAMDLNEYRAYRQTISEKWANGAIKAVSTVGTSIGEAGGMVSFLPLAIAMQDSDMFFKNPITNMFASIQDSVNRAMPNYMSQAERDASFLESLGTANFWSDQGLNAVGYMAGAFLGGGRIGAAVFKGLRSVVLGAKVGKLGITGSSLLNAHQASAMMKWARGASTLTAAAVMRTGESGVEANEVYDRVLAETGSIEKAKEARLLTFNTNMLLAIPDAWQFSKVFAGFNNYKKGIRALKTTQDGVEVAKRGILKKTIDTLKEPLQQIVVESQEENFQLAAANAVEKLITKDFSLDSWSDTKKFAEALLLEMGRNFDNKEGQQSMLIGGLLGGGMGTFIGYQSNKQIDKNTKEVIDRYNKFNQPIKDGMTAWHELEKGKIEAAKRGNKLAFNFAKELQFNNWVRTKLEAGQFDNFMEELDLWSTASPEEVKQSFGVAEPGTTSAGTEETPKMLIEKFKAKARQLKKTYEAVENLIEDARPHVKEKLFHSLAAQTFFDEKIMALAPRKLEAEATKKTMELLGSSFEYTLDQQAAIKDLNDAIDAKAAFIAEYKRLLNPKEQLKEEKKLKRTVTENRKKVVEPEKKEQPKAKPQTQPVKNSNPKPAVEDYESLKFPFSTGEEVSVKGEETTRHTIKNVMSDKDGKTMVELSNGQIVEASQLQKVDDSLIFDDPSKEARALQLNKLVDEYQSTKTRLDRIAATDKILEFEKTNPGSVPTEQLAKFIEAKKLMLEKQAAEDTAKKADEEKLAQEAEAKRLAEEEEQKKREAEAEIKRQEDEARKKAEEENKSETEISKLVKAAKKKAEKEQKKLEKERKEQEAKEMQEAEEAKRQEEEESKREADEEIARKKAEEDEIAKIKAAQEEERKRLEEEAKGRDNDPPVEDGTFNPILPSEDPQNAASPTLLRTTGSFEDSLRKGDTQALRFYKFMDKLGLNYSGLKLKVLTSKGDGKKDPLFKKVLTKSQIDYITAADIADPSDKKQTVADRLKGWDDKPLVLLVIADERTGEPILVDEEGNISEAGNPVATVPRRHEESTDQSTRAISVKAFMRERDITDDVEGEKAYKTLVIQHLEFYKKLQNGEVDFLQITGKTAGIPLTSKTEYKSLEEVLGITDWSQPLSVAFAIGTVREYRRPDQPIKLADVKPTEVINIKSKPESKMDRYFEVFRNEDGSNRYVWLRNEWRGAEILDDSRIKAEQEVSRKFESAVNTAPVEVEEIYHIVTTNEKRTATLSNAGENAVPIYNSMDNVQRVAPGIVHLVKNGVAIPLKPRTINGSEALIVAKLFELYNADPKEEKWFHARQQIEKLIYSREAATNPKYRLYAAGGFIFFGETGKIPVEDAHKNKEFLSFLLTKNRQASNKDLRTNPLVSTVEDVVDGTIKYGPKVPYYQFLFGGKDAAFTSNLLPNTGSNVQFKNSYFRIDPSKIESKVSEAETTFDTKTDEKKEQKQEDMKLPTFKSKGKGGLGGVKFRLPTRRDFEYQKQDIEQVQREFKRFFGVTVPLHLTDNLVLGKGWGAFVNNAVYLYKNAEVGTVYHEAFHVVTQMFLTEKERASLYEEARKHYGDLSDLRLEEKLAEDFREYVLSEGAKVFGKAPRKQNAFQRILAFIKRFLFGQVEVQTIYKEIIQGRYANRIPVGKPQFTRLFSLPDKTEEDTKLIMESITSIFFSELNASQYTPIKMLASDELREAAYNEVHDNLLSYYNSLRQFADENPDLANSMELQYRLNIYRYILENYDTVLRHHAAYMKQFGVSISSQKKNAGEKHIVQEDPDTVEDSNSSQIEDPDQNGNEVSREKAFDSPQNEKNTLEFLSTAVRILLQSLPKRTLDRNEDGSYKIATNKMGVEELNDFNYTYKLLISKLAGELDSDRIFAKIKALALRHPHLYDLLERLKVDAPAVSLTTEQIILRNQFLQDMKKFESQGTVTLINDETGQIYTLGANRHNLLNRISDKWISQIRLNAIPNADGILTINSEHLAIEDTFEFLEALGIAFTEATPAQVKAAFSKEAENVLRKTIDEYSRKGKPITDIFSSKSDMVERLRPLLELEAENNTDVIEHSYVSATNKTIYPINQYDYYSMMTAEINNAENIDELYAKAPWLNTSFSKGSRLLDILFSGPGGSKAIDVKTRRPIKLLYNTVAGMKIEDQIDSGTSATDLEPGDKFVQELADFLDNGTISLMRASDKSTEHALGLSTGQLIVPVTSVLESFRTPEVLLGFRKYFKAELDRINDLTKSGIGRDIEYYKDKGKTFQIFAEILDEETKQMATVYGPTDEVLNKVDELVVKFLEDLTKENLALAKSYRIGENLQDGLVMGISTKFNKMSMNHIMRAFTVNHFMSMVEQQMLLIGDPAFFKDGDMFKRISGGTGTKKIADVSAYMNEWLRQPVKISTRIRRTSATGEKTYEFIESEIPQRLDGRDPNGEIDVWILNDVKASSKYFDDYVHAVETDFGGKDKAEEILDAYDKMDEGDAGALISLDEYRQFSLRTGTEWGLEKEEQWIYEIAWEKRDKGMFLTPVEEEILKKDHLSNNFGSILEVRKGQNFGPQVYEGLNAPAFHKYSLFPMTYRMVKGTNMEKLYNQMQANKIGYFVFKSGSKVGTKMQPTSIKYTDYTNYSGGAAGGDAAWKEIGQEFGLGKQVDFRPEILAGLTVGQKTEIETAYQQAVKDLGRVSLSADSFGGGLVRRDYLQAKAADSVFAISAIVEPGQKDKKGYVNKTSRQVVEGGTGYAVQMAINLGKPVYVFDQNKNKWFAWDSGQNKFVEASTPKLTKKFAGIGTRELKDNGKQAIRAVYNNEVSYVVPELYDKEGNVDDFSKLQPQTIRYKFLGIQLDVAAKTKEKVVFGTQFRKLLITNLFSFGKAVSDKFAALAEEYNKIEDTLIRREFNNLLEELGINLEDGVYRHVNLQTLVEKVREALSDRAVADNLLDSLQVKTNPDGTVTLRYPIDALVNRNKIESMLLAIVNSRVIRQKMNGDGYIQVPSSLTEAIGAREFKTGKNGTKMYSSNHLKHYQYKDGDTMVTKSEVMIAASGQFKEFVKYYGSLDKLNAALEDGSFVDKFGEKAITMVGYRIPTQGPNSMEIMLIKKFLPEVHGSTVILPTELVAKSGGDYDIDKLNIFRPNYNLFDVGYKRTPTYVTPLTKEQIEKIYNKVKEIGIDTLALQFEFDRYGTLSKSDISEILENNNWDMPVEEFVANFQQSTAALENRLLEIATNILLDPAMFKYLITPNSTATLTDAVWEIRWLQSGGKGTIEDFKKEFTAKKVSGTRQSSWAFILDQFKYFLGGKSGVGIAAVHNTHHVLSQQANVELEESYNTGRSDRSVKKTKIFFKHNKSDSGKITLAGIKTVAGELISDLLGQFINAYVDVAKDPFYKDLNAGTSTAGVYFYLIRAGVSFKEVAKFMTQPIIKQFIDAESVNASSFIDAAGEKRSVTPVSPKRLEMIKQQMHQIQETIKAESFRSTADSKSNIALLEEQRQALLEEMNSIFAAVAEPYRKAAERLGIEPRKEEDYIEISEHRLTSNLQNPDMSNADYVLDQLQLLDNFMEYREQASHLTDFMQSTNFDTSTFKNMGAISQKQELIKAVHNTGFISPETRRRVLSKTVVGAFDKMNEIQEMYSPLFISENNSAVRTAVKEIIDEIGTSKEDFAKMYEYVTNEYIGYLTHKHGTIADGSELTSHIKRILVGKNSLARRLASLKIRKDLADNIVVRELQPKLSDKENGPDIAKIYARRLSAHESNTITEGFVQLLNHQDPEVQSVGKDLMYLAIIQSGLHNSADTYLPLIPYYEYADIVNRALEVADKSGHNLRDFRVRFFIKNAWNNRIVPTRTKRNRRALSEREFIKVYKGSEKGYEMLVQFNEDLDLANDINWLTLDQHPEFKKRPNIRPTFDNTFQNWFFGTAGMPGKFAAKLQKVASEGAGSEIIKKIANKLSEQFGIKVKYVVSPLEAWAGKFENGYAVLNLAYAGLDTPFHEFAHPFVAAIKIKNPVLYENLKKQLLESREGREIYAQTATRYKDLSDEDLLEEAIVEAIGRYAARTLVKGGLYEAIKILMKRVMTYLKEVIGNPNKIILPEELPADLTLEEIGAIFNLGNSIAVPTIYESFEQMTAEMRKIEEKLLSSGVLKLICKS